MTEFGGRGSFGERIVMVCAVCQNNHHEQNAIVFVQDPTGVARRVRCPICCCIDCVQTSSDPIRTQLRPRIMGQTLSSQYNLDVEEFKKGDKEPTRRILNIKAPGPLNLKDAMSSIQGLLGIQPVGPEKQHRIGQGTGCDCGKNAVSKCISCEEPLCMRCLKKHECE